MGTVACPPSGNPKLCTLRGFSMKAVFTKQPGGRYLVHAHRPDGSVVAMPTSDRTFRVPHDLAHYAVEHAFGLADGVFGVVMSGGLFDKMSMVSGRRRHDEAARSAAVLRAANDSHTIAAAEVLAGVIHHAVETGDSAGLAINAREQWGIVRQDDFPYSEAEVRTARDLLAELDRRWQRLPVGESLDLTWTTAVSQIR